MQYFSEKFQYEFSSSDNNFWIGADILTSKGNWKWTDKSSFDFSDWKSGEPKNITGLECAAVSNSDGYWSAENCSEKKPFVCGIAFLPAICESTWLYFEFTKSYYCGFGVFGTTRWGDGENYCNHLGGHLTSIHSQEEASFLNCKTNLFTF
uniref:C-type lectin domain-containing protein n=1 Tax=Panagrolaimus sp. ES5 TaxID=591445 RepID=A0AC34FP94_9BILA